MEVIVCNPSKILPTNISFKNIDECYQYISTECNQQLLWDKFNNIILYECFTFYLIMKIINPDIKIFNEYINWIDKANLFDEINDVSKNYILNNFFNKLGYNIKEMNLKQISDLLKPMGEHLKNTYEQYIDIYDKDKHNIQTFHGLRNKTEFDDQSDLHQPFILFSKNQYRTYI